MAWLNAAVGQKVSAILLKQAENKAELKQEQQEVKDDLDEKHAENKENYHKLEKAHGEHLVEDRLTFAAIKDLLIRIEARQKRQTYRGEKETS